MNADTVAALEKRVTKAVTDTMFSAGDTTVSSVVLALTSAPDASNVALEIVAEHLSPASMLRLGLDPEEIKLVEEWRETRVNVLPFRARIVKAKEAGA